MRFATVMDSKKASRNAARTRMRQGPTDFVALDGEGVTIGSEHRYVLLSVGSESLYHQDETHLNFPEIARFLYDNHKPRTAFIGFYLGYDFNQWLRTLPEERASRLLTLQGQAARRVPAERSKIGYDFSYPVEWRGWQFDMLGMKRFKFRPKMCMCDKSSFCDCPKKPWMFICDVGPFWQMPFLKAINPKNWNEPIVSQEEYELIERGKERRSDARLDEDMITYNLLENQVLVRAMKKVDEGFRELGIELKANQWFGPGQAAQNWMHRRSPKREEYQDSVPNWFRDAANASYYGGWFEIFMHGLIPGVSHEYDINSAYPWVIASLPCLLHGKYSRGTGRPKNVSRDALCLVRARVWSRSPFSEQNGKMFIGSMLHRMPDGSIKRPQVTEGWFWWDELEAARKAGCITYITEDRCYEWMLYEPCDCPKPMRQVAYMYERRLAVGKRTPLGISAKLAYNSMAGKYMQSVGSPMYGNAVYASRITSGCRTKILDAIGTHPGGKENVIMVATDGVYFLEPHPALTCSEELGQWDHETHENLTVFKPGTYWDDKTRAAIAEGEAPQFKSRGVSARDIKDCLGEIDEQFAAWNGECPPKVPWPSVEFPASFAMITCIMALQWGRWDLAGSLIPDKKLKQSGSENTNKREGFYYDSDRNVYRSEPHTPHNFILNMGTGKWDYEDVTSIPYAKRFGIEDPWSDEYKSIGGITPDGYLGELLSWAFH